MASAELSLIEDDIAVSLQILEKLKERESELRAEIDRISNEKQMHTDLIRKLEKDRLRVAEEEREVEERVHVIDELEATKESLMARVTNIESELAAIEASVRGDPEEPNDEKCEDMAEQLGALERTLEQKLVRVANRERTIAEKRKQLKEAQGESTLKEFIDLKEWTAAEKLRGQSLLADLASARENMKRILSHRDMGDGSGIYARQLVIAELAQSAHSEEEDEEEEEDMELIAAETRTITNSLAELRVLRAQRETALKQELESLINNEYLRTLREEREELERSFLEKL